MFDPWTASYDDVIREKDLWEKSNGSVSSPLNPLLQADAACRIMEMKDGIERGDGFAVLGAIRICVTHGLVAPEWLAYAFNRRYDAVNFARVGSWDDPLAFGRPYPKGRQLATVRKARAGRLAVWVCVVAKLRESPETPIDKGLFEEIGKPLGFGTTLTEKYYYEQKELFRKMFGENSEVARMSPSPAKIRKLAGLRKKRV